MGVKKKGREEYVEGIELPLESQYGGKLYCYVTTAPYLVTTGYYEGTQIELETLSKHHEGCCECDMTVEEVLYGRKS